MACQNHLLWVRKKKQNWAQKSSTENSSLNGGIRHYYCIVDCRYDKLCQTSSNVVLSAQKMLETEHGLNSFSIIKCGLVGSPPSASRRWPWWTRRTARRRPTWRTPVQIKPQFAGTFSPAGLCPSDIGPLRPLKKHAFALPKWWIWLKETKHKLWLNFLIPTGSNSCGYCGSQRSFNMREIMVPNSAYRLALLSR